MNTLQIIGGRVTVAGNALDRGNVEAARESLRTASATTDRMSGIVEDLSVLARHGKTLEDTERVDFRAAVADAWADADVGDLSLSVEGDADVVADPTRVRELLASAFAFAAHNDANEVVVERGDDWFAVAGDGRPPGDADPEAFFEYGSAVPDSEADILLPNVRMLAAVHGWSASLDTEYEQGVRVVVSGTGSVSRSGDDQ